MTRSKEIKEKLPVQEENSQTGKELPKFTQTDEKQIGLMIELDESTWAKFTKQILGTCDNDALHYFIEQLLPTVRGNEQSKIAENINKLVPLLTAIKPRDELEGMLAIQMVGIHNLAMDMMRRTLHTDRVDFLNNYSNQVAKLTRTFTAQLEALDKHRGKGQQKMTVEHVHVNKGGQAVIGNVERGEGEKES